MQFAVNLNCSSNLDLWWSDFNALAIFRPPVWELCMDIDSDAANPGTAAALVDEASSADKDVEELLGDLEYHFGVVRPDAEGGVVPEDADCGCSLYLPLTSRL
jgi:hypothetical protein